MVSTLVKFGLPLALVAFLYQTVIHDVVFVILGIGRHIQDAAEFPYTCRRIEDPRLQACEDMFLSDATRQLFLACSEPLARSAWMPNIGRFNATGRSRTDAIVALDIDKPTKVNGRDSFGYRVLQQTGYPIDTHDDPSLHLVGMTGIDSPNTIELFLVNAKPSRGTDGEILDQAAVGANSTIEKFITGPAATSMKHVKTYSSPNIATPNNIATAPGMKGFYFTNDHGPYKTGFRHGLSQILKRGDVSYCDTTNPARPVCMKLASGINFPNGLLYHPEHGLLYVPSAANGNIHVFRPHYTPGSSMPRLDKVHEIKIPYPIDNLSLDTYTGDIYAPGFPAAPPMMAGFDDPLNVFAPSTHHRVRLVETDGGKLKYDVEKVLEHGGGKGAPFSGITTIVRDGKTGRLFLSGKS